MPHAAALCYLDYLDPASFLVELRLAHAEATEGIRAERRPFEVVPPPGPLLDPDHPAWVARWEDAARALEREWGLAPVRPRLLPWTRKAWELALHAKEEECFETVHEALFRAFHLDGRDLGRVDVLVEIAVDAGLDRTGTRVVLDVDRHRDGVAELRKSAERRGVRGVPTVVVRGRVHESPLDADTLRALLAECRRP